MVPMVHRPCDEKVHHSTCRKNQGAHQLILESEAGPNLPKQDNNDAWRNHGRVSPLRSQETGHDHAPGDNRWKSKKPVGGASDENPLDRILPESTIDQQAGQNVHDAP